MILIFSLITAALDEGNYIGFIGFIGHIGYIGYAQPALTVVLPAQFSFTDYYSFLLTISHIICRDHRLPLFRNTFAIRRNQNCN